MAYLVAFVGPSGSGKTMLIMEALARLPERVGLVQSVTTRPSRSTPEDDAFYRFVTAEEHLALRAAGELLTDVTLAGNYYGTPKSSVESLLPHKHAMIALLEYGVLHWRKAGLYPLKVIKMVPKNFVPPNISAQRKEEDAIRNQIDIAPDLIVANDFGPGGREQAIATVLDFLSKLD